MHLNGLSEWFHWSSGDSAKMVVAREVVFPKALVNTLAFVVILAPVQAGLALLLALLINQRLGGINVFRMIHFMPVVVSIVAVSLLWGFIYSGDKSLLSNILGAVSFAAFEPQDWLGDPETALASIIAVSIWQAWSFT